MHPKKKLSHLIKIPLALLAVFGIGVVIFPQAGNAAMLDVSPFMGKFYDGDSEDGAEAYLDFPQAFAWDTSGKFFIADTNNNVIRLLDGKNIMKTYAGTGYYGLRDGGRTVARFAEPAGVDRGSNGIIYVSDTGNSKIRSIKGGIVSTMKIDGLRNPKDILRDGSKLYIVDWGNNRIVRVADTGGTVEELAADLQNPQKMCIQKNDLYFTEHTTGKIWEIDLTTKKKTLIATGLVEPKAIFCDGELLYFTAGQNGVWNEIWKLELDHPNKRKTRIALRRETTSLNDVTDIIVAKIDRKDGTPVTEEGKNVASASKKKAVTSKPEKRIYQLHGGGGSIYSTDLTGNDLRFHAGKNRYGDENGKRSVALVGHPQELAMSPDGMKLYIVYSQGNKMGVYDFGTDKFTGTAGFPRDSYAEGTAFDVRMSDVVSIVVSPDGEFIYFVDRNNNRIRRINTTNWKSSYVTGAGLINSAADDNNGYQEGKACKNEIKEEVGKLKAGCAYFNRPTGLAISSDGETLYVADGSNNRIRKVNIGTGQTELIAGSGNAGFVNGVGSAAEFNGPFTLTISLDNKTLYVADKNNHAIRKIDIASKTVSTLAGQGRIGYREGAFKDAFFAIPEYIEMGPDGNLIVTEAGSLRIRKLDLKEEKTSLVAGNGSRGADNGSGPSTTWNAPKGMIFRGSTLYVTDFKNDLIRRIDLSTGNDVAVGLTFDAFSPSLRGGYSVAVGNVTGNADKELIVGMGSGLGSEVRIFTSKGKWLKTFTAYSGSKAGVRVSVGNLDSDTLDEIVVVPGSGAAPLVKIFNGEGKEDAKSFSALDGKFKGGAFVAVGDFDGNKKEDIAITAGKGGGAQVVVYHSNGKSLASFFAYDKNSFRNGISVAAVDTNGDGKDEILTGPEAGSPHVQIFMLDGKGSAKALMPGFFAFDPNYKGGVRVAGVDLDGNHKDEIMISAGEDPVIKIYDKSGTKVLNEFHPYASSIEAGAMVAGGDTDGDKKEEVVTAPTANAGPSVRVFNEEDL